MQSWMNDVPATVRATQRRLRAEVPDLAGRYARLSEALNDRTVLRAVADEHIDTRCFPHKTILHHGKWGPEVRVNGGRGSPVS